MVPQTPLLAIQLQPGHSLVPSQALLEKQSTYRSIKINGEEIEFSHGFTELHTESYKKILKGDGFTLAEARSSIELAYIVRNSIPIGLKGDYHPFLKEKRITA